VPASSIGSYAANVVSLLHFDGNMTDTSGKVWTSVDAATVNSTQFKFGGGSLALDGVGDSLTTPTSTDFDLTNSGDWTMDFWINPAADLNYRGIALTAPYGNVGTTGWSMRFSLATGNTAPLEFLIGAYTVLTSSLTVTAGQWNHVALVNTSSTFRWYINGVADTNYSATYPTPSTAPLILGKAVTYSAGHWLSYAGYDYSGYIDDFRITK